MENQKILGFLLTAFVLLIFGLCAVSNIFAFAREREQQIEIENSIIKEDPVVSCLEKGKELFWKQKYDEAIEQLKDCLEMDSDNPEIYYYLGQAYFQHGQEVQGKSPIKAYRLYQKAYDVSDTAIEKYKQQIEKNPEESHTNEYLQLAYIHQIRSLIPGVNEYQQALDIYNMLLLQKPHIHSAYYHMGWIYYQQEEYEKAIETYLKYLEPGIKNGFVYYYLGLSYDKIGERQQAEYYFKLILEEFPNTEMADRAKKELD